MGILYTQCSKYCTAGVDKLSVKDQMVNILGFWGHMVSILTAQIFHSSTKAAREHKSMNEYDGAPINIYLPKQVTDQI